MGYMSLIMCLLTLKYSGTYAVGQLLLIVQRMGVFAGRQNLQAIPAQLLHFVTGQAWQRKLGNDDLSV